MSGWEARHCGHPTANWPYWLLDPAHPDATTVSYSGHGFRNSGVAMDVVEAILAGRATTTDEDCADGVRRVPELTAGGLPAPVRRTATARAS